MNKMNHLPFEIICRIADKDIPQNEMMPYNLHLESCKSCKREIEIQKTILSSAKQAQLADTSANFTENILKVIVPSQKRKLSEWLLHNMGNIIAMVSVLAFLGYVYLTVQKGDFHIEQSKSQTPISEISKIVQEGSSQFISLLKSKLSIPEMGKSHANIIIFVLIAIGLLAFIDRITQYFIRRQRS
jgi:hypothetical protein